MKRKKSGWEDDSLLEITPLIVNRIVNSRFQRINVQIYTIYLKGWEDDNLLDYPT